MKDMRLSVLVIGLVLLIVINGTSQNDKPKCKRLPPELPEVSGNAFIAPNQWWWHNDGGHPAVLYRTDGRGQLQERRKLGGITNVDWEDLTQDNQGHFYIGDFGNNRNQRRNLKIYRYHRTTEKIDSILFFYPEQKEFPPKPADQIFDTEAFFYYNDSLHLFTKNKVGQGNYFTRHYVIPATPGAYTAQLVDSLALANRVLTAAAISMDHQTVALLGYNYGRFLGIFPWIRSTVFIIRDFQNTRFLKGTIYRQRAPGFLFPKQYEALDFWDNQNLYLASERVAFFRQKAKRLKIKKRFLRK